MRDRWLGLEQEGFGIVFLEAAACGTPQLAGHSGGSDEAVEDGRTSKVVERPSTLVRSQKHCEPCWQIKNNEMKCQHDPEHESSNNSPTTRSRNGCLTFCLSHRTVNEEGVD